MLEMLDLTTAVYKNRENIKSPIECVCVGDCVLSPFPKGSLVNINRRAATQKTEVNRFARLHQIP